MQIRNVKLWTDIENTERPKMTAYIPDEKKCDGSVVICPGGGYRQTCPHEGKAYANFFAAHGIVSFVLDYRVAPDSFPFPLADAQRAIQTVRRFAREYGIDKNKIAVMGSSAGGHLAALVSTYRRLVYDATDEISKEDFIPNAQILCYPVITLVDKRIAHADSTMRFLGSQAEKAQALSPDLIADSRTPQAFIWHTAEDNVVHVFNSLDYVKRLKSVGVSVEIHIFPKGKHGLGLARGEDKIQKHISRWTTMLRDWLKYIDFI